MIFENTHLKF
jgi:hypothetical protein